MVEGDYEKHLGVDDLHAANAAGQAAADACGDDGGTCNLDAPMIRTRWKKHALAALQIAGGAGYEHGGRIVVSMPCLHSGQARRREKAAEAMARELAKRGYAASLYRQMD